jgi:hypothetical protein
MGADAAAVQATQVAPGFCILLHLGFLFARKSLSGTLDGCGIEVSQVGSGLLLLCTPFCAGAQSKLSCSLMMGCNLLTAPCTTAADIHMKAAAMFENKHVLWCPWCRWYPKTLKTRDMLVLSFCLCNVTCW